MYNFSDYIRELMIITRRETQQGFRVYTHTHVSSLYTHMCMYLPCTYTCTYSRVYTHMYFSCTHMYILQSIHKHASSLYNVHTLEYKHTCIFLVQCTLYIHLYILFGVYTHTCTILQETHENTCCICRIYMHTHLLYCRMSGEFPQKLVHLVYCPVLSCIICKCTVQLALAGQMSARFLKLNRT